MLNNEKHIQMGQMVRLEWIDDHFRSEYISFIHCGHFPFNEPSEKLLYSLRFKPYGQHTVGSVCIIDEIRQR